MDLDDLRYELSARLTDLHAQYHNMINPDCGPLLAAEAVEWWAKALEGTQEWEPGIPYPAGHAAEAVLQHLIPAHERNGSAFWGTALGRTIALLGHAPISTGPELGSTGPRVGGAVVGAILGITRSRVFELQKAGRLLTQAQVAEELRTRLDGA